MKNFVLLLCIVSVFAVFTAGADAQDGQYVPSISQDTSVDVPVAAEEVEKADRLTRRQKKELGILPIQVLRRAKELAKDGDLVKDMSSREMAFVYAADVASSAEYGGAWRQVSDGTYGADWDQIIDFLERLFELLVKFLPLFI